MLFRLLLVGVVTGLGVEPPSRTEVATWAESGRAWVLARMDDFGGARLTAQNEAEAKDAAFSSVVDDMAGTFAADLARLDRPARPALGFEPIEVVDLPESTFVASLDFPGQGVGVRAEAQAAVELAPSPSPAPAPSRVSDRLNRLASALRLTRQAASAWASVIDEPGSASTLR